MNRREFIAAIGGAIAWPLEGRSQGAPRTYRIAYLALAGTNESAFVKERLKELGYEEGVNLIFDLRSAQGRIETLDELAGEVVEARPDIIITGFGTATAKAAQTATRTIPVVFSNVGDPVGSGIVSSLSRPGANLTGLAAQAAEIGGKRLEILGQFVPGMHTVAALQEPGAPFSIVALPVLQKAAQDRGQHLMVCNARSGKEVESSLRAARDAGAEGLVVLETPVLIGLRDPIIDISATLRLPAIYSVRDFVHAGGFLCYGPDDRQLYRRAAELADKILKGENPAQIPVEQPTKFDLVVNLKAAKALELAVPATLLALADEVIE
ncbi:MAG: ABC transporter substrate-binding protein [Hyphomicrobiales bacterium]|nr:ABC transporter substrate-binding protein [Hyphomicrobiales bacterium]